MFKVGPGINAGTDSVGRPEGEEIEARGNDGTGLGPDKDEFERCLGVTWCIGIVVLRMCYVSFDSAKFRKLDLGCGRADRTYCGDCDGCKVGPMKSAEGVIWNGTLSE